MSLEKNSPMSASYYLNTSGQSNLGGSQKEDKESIKQMDSLMQSIMIETEKSSIEHLEQMTQFFQEQAEEEGRRSFREELLKYIQTEFRFQEMSILDPEQLDFVDSIRTCYKNMQDLMKKGLKPSHQEIEYLNFFSKVLQIKESLLSVYQTLGNYHHPISFIDILKQLTKFFQVLQKEKNSFTSLQYRPGMTLYSNFLTFELKALLQLALTLQEQENYYGMYAHEKLLCQLVKLKQTISEWISLFKDQKNDCNYSKFKQIVFLQNFHLLLKAKLDFYAPEYKFQFQHPFSELSQQSNMAFLESTQKQLSHGTAATIQEYPTMASRLASMSIQTQVALVKQQNSRLDQQLNDRCIFKKLFKKFQELYPQTFILILQRGTSEKLKQKLASLEKENELMQRKIVIQPPQETQPAQETQPTQEVEQIGEYRVAFKQCSFEQNIYKEHLTRMMELFKQQIELIDNYIECSKYLMNSLQQYLFYKLDDEYYLLFEVYEMKDKKQINSTVEYISHLCELLRNRSCLVVSKENGKPPLRTFSDFIKEKFDLVPVNQQNSQIRLNFPNSQQNSKVK